MLKKAVSLMLLAVFAYADTDTVISFAHDIGAHLATKLVEVVVGGLPPRTAPAAVAYILKFDVAPEPPWIGMVLINWLDHAVGVPTSAVVGT